MGDNEFQYPFDAEEDKKRLSRNHALIRAAMGGTLVLAPIDLTRPNLKVLDNGTSDGFWILDFITDYPAIQTVIGTDIDDSRFPKSSPKSVNFVKQDIREAYPLGWKASFDFVHQRFLLVGATGDPQPCVNSICELVKPGGWVQMIEADQTVGENDGPATRQFLALMKAMVDSLGTPFYFAQDLARYLREAGFIKIGEMTVPMAHGAANPRPELREQSVQAFLQAVTGLIEFSKTLPAIEGVSKKDLDTLPSRVENEMRTQGNYYPLRAVWGQKPVE